MRYFFPNAWVNDSRGATAIVFALLLLPLVLVVGLAIDVSRQVGAKQKIIYAADAAALAGARALQDSSLSDDAVKEIISESFAANRDHGWNNLACGSITPQVNRGQSTVNLEVECKIATVFPDILHNTEQLNVAHESESHIILPSMDIALMLDMSGSMEDGTRLSDLKSGAKNLISTLLSAQSGQRVRIALIPYGDAVNAGIYGNRAQGKLDDNDADGDGARVCVSRRENSISEFTDHAPVAFHWVGDLTGIYCDEPMIVPLSSDADMLKVAIDAMDAKGRSTAGHLGIAWSWYALSSKWADIWPDGSKPLPNGDPHVTKVVVMMTDGVFNAYRTSSDDRRPGYEASPVATKEFCKQMHAEGILIYAIGLDVQEPVLGGGFSLGGDEAVRQAWIADYGPNQLLAFCAQDASRFSEPDDSSDLIDIYNDIAERLKIESVSIAG
ncbi:MAG: vWA domain-containing protein [Pseudomonadota bacterium]